jgi:hypothetical protein
MKRKVMAPFRAPREGRGRDKTTKASQKKGMDNDSEDKGKGVPLPFKDKTTKARPVKRAERPRRQKLDRCTDSGEPTALGLVCGSPQEVAEEDDDASNPWWPKDSPERATKSVVIPAGIPSPHLSEFEALLDDLEKLSSVTCHKKNVVAIEATNSDNEDDEIPLAQLARDRQPICGGKEVIVKSGLAAKSSRPKTTFVPETQNEIATSDTEDDLLPLHELVSKQKEGMQSPNEEPSVFPKGYASGM